MLSGGASKRTPSKTTPPSDISKHFLKNMKRIATLLKTQTDQFWSYVEAEDFDDFVYFSYMMEHRCSKDNLTWENTAVVRKSEDSLCLLSFSLGDGCVQRVYNVKIQFRWMVLKFIHSCCPLTPSYSPSLHDFWAFFKHQVLGSWEVETGMNKTLTQYLGTPYGLVNSKSVYWKPWSPEFWNRHC